MNNITRACGHVEQIDVPEGHRLNSKKIECAACILERKRSELAGYILIDRALSARGEDARREMTHFGLSMREVVGVASLGEPELLELAAKFRTGTDRYCITLPDGSCASNHPECMHNKGAKS